MLSDITPEVSFSKRDITTDIAGQLAVSQRTLTQSWLFANTAHALFTSKQELNGGTVTLDTSKAAMVLSTTTASNSSAAMETKKVIQYLAGQGHTVAASITFGTAKTNVSKRWGLYSDTNGFYIQQTGSGLEIVYRSNISGSVVNTTITQANWNSDKLDGTGPSGFNLDVTKGAVFLLEYTWHGAGRVRFGIKAAKENIYFHEFDFDNAQAYTYTRNPYQPIKAEIINTGTPASATSFYVHTISAYVHNHRTEVANIIFTASRGVDRKDMTNSVYRPLIAIRPKLLFNSRINRATVEPVSVQAVAIERVTEFQVILNPTSITGASWASVNDYSVVEFDTAATDYTGGTVIQSFYAVTNSTLLTGAIEGLGTSQIGAFPLGLSIDGTSQDVLLVVGRTTDGNSRTLANITWKEYQ